MNSDSSVSVLGTSIVVASWTALFLAAGYIIRVYDPNDSGGIKLRP